MPNYYAGTHAVRKTVLSFWGVRAFLFQLLLITAAVALPVFAHLTGMPVRILLPMHWPVILAGLVYGWRGGALIGFFAPAVSFLISGRPLPEILPAMTLELFTYGFMTGLLREHFRLNSIASVLIALVLGRTVFIISTSLLSAVSANYLQYIKTALLPGLAAGLGQIVLLPFLAGWWVKQGQK